MQGAFEQSFVVDAELVPPIAPEPPPKIDPQKPETKQEPLPPPSKLIPNTEQPSLKPIKADTGVALPVIAEKTETPSNPNDHLVADALDFTRFTRRFSASN